MDGERNVTVFKTQNVGFSHPMNINGSTVKMCVKCQRLLPLDTLACPSCGGIVFKIVAWMRRTKWTEMQLQ